VQDYWASHQARAAGEVEGFFWRGKLYLVADQLATPRDVARVLYHEARHQRLERRRSITSLRSPSVTPRGHKRFRILPNKCGQFSLGFANAAIQPCCKDARAMHDA